MQQKTEDLCDPPFLHVHELIVRNTISGEKEKYLCFDRKGSKYTVVIQEGAEQPNGNPSYFRFLPKVKQYKPTPRAAKLRKMKERV